MFRKGFLLREGVQEGEDKTEPDPGGRAAGVFGDGGSNRNWQKGAFLHRL